MKPHCNPNTKHAVYMSIVNGVFDIIDATWTWTVATEQLVNMKLAAYDLNRQIATE